MGERDVSTRLGNLPDRGGIEAAVAAEAVWQMDRYPMESREPLQWWLTVSSLSKTRRGNAFARSHYHSDTGAETFFNPRWRDAASAVRRDQNQPGADAFLEAGKSGHTLRLHAVVTGELKMSCSGPTK